MKGLCNYLGVTTLEKHSQLLWGSRKEALIGLGLLVGKCKCSPGLTMCRYRFQVYIIYGYRNVNLRNYKSWPRTFETQNFTRDKQTAVLGVFLQLIAQISIGINGPAEDEVLIKNYKPGPLSGSVS